MNSKGVVFNWMHAAIVTKIENDRIYITQTNGRHCDLLAEKITVCDHAFDLYSYHWPQNTGTPYKVNFDSNGGTCSTASKAVYSPGKFGDLPEPVPPTIDTEWLKSENKFTGWFTSKDDYGTQVTADSNVQLNADTTLYARYGTCLFTPEEVTGGYKWFQNLGDEASVKESFNVTYQFKIPNEERSDGYETYCYIRAYNSEQAGKKIGEMSLYDYDSIKGYVKTDKPFTPPVKEGYEFVGWYSDDVAEDIVYDDTNRGEQITEDSVIELYGKSERIYYAHYRKIDDAQRTEVTATVEQQKITLKWSLVADAAAYNVYKMDDNGDYVLVSAVSGESVDAMEYVDEEIIIGKNYHYMVKPITNGMESIGTIYDVSNKVKGDVTNDGNVNLLDAQKVLKIALRIGTYTEEEEADANVDGNEGVTLTDALMVLKHALNVEKLK